MKLVKGDNAPLFQTKDIFGKEISLNKYKGKKVLLSFLRNIECIYCNYRIIELEKAKEDLLKNDLQVILFIQSNEETIQDILDYHSDFPFTIIADSKKETYQKYGVRSSIWGWFLTMIETDRIRKAKKIGLRAKKNKEGDDMLMPADFLLNEDLKISDLLYGIHGGHHISIKKIKKTISVT